MLTTGTDKMTGGEGADTFTAVSSGLISTRTLNAEDVLDGGAGTDTLTLSMSADFGGFTDKVGSMKGIEVLNITNTSDLSRTFNATGATDIATVKVDTNKQNFTVSNLAAAGVTLEVSNATAGKTITAGFTTAAVAGSADALTVVLNGAGAAKTTDTAQVTETLTASGIENLTLTAAGAAHYVTAAGAASKTVTINGSGIMKLDAVAAGVTAVDASKATGAQELTLTAATALESASTGSGADKVSVKGISVEATLAGGEGADELILDDVSGTKQPTVTGFETITIKNGGTTGAAILAASKVSGVTKVQVTDDLDANFTIAELSNTSLDIALTEAKDTTFGTDANDLTYTSKGTANFALSSGNTAGGTINTNLVASGAETVNLNIAKGVTSSSTLTAAAATTVALTVDGTSSGAITAAKATSVTATLGASSAFTNKITAASATSVTVNSKDTDAIALDLVTAKASTVNITSASNVTFAGTTNLTAASTVSLSSTGTVNTTGAAAFGTTATSVTVDATGVKGAFTTSIGALAAGGGSAVVSGSTLADNTITIAGGRNEVSVTTGIGSDSVTFGAALTGEGNYTFNLGSLGTDTVTFTGTNVLDSANVTFSGVEVIDTATSTTLKAASLTGQTVKVQGTALVLSGTASGDTITMANFDSTSAAALTVNAGAGGDTVTGSGKADTINGDDGADTISGGAGNDTLNGGAGVDSITGGEGQDSITGGAGADVIILTETTAVADTVRIAATTDFGDVITGFAAGAGDDVLSFLTAMGVNGTPAATLASIASNGTVGANDVFIEITTATAAGGADTAAEIVTHLAGLTATNLAATDKVFFAVNDGTDMYIWYNQSTAGGVPVAGDLTLAAKLIGVTDIADGDLALA